MTGLRCLTSCVLLLVCVLRSAESSRIKGMLKRGCKYPCNSLIIPLSDKPSDEVEVVLHYVNIPVGKMPLFMCRNCGCDLCKQALQLGYFAAPTTKVFHHILDKQCGDGRALVVDAGANVGYFTVMSAAAYGCRVVAFEPNPGPRMYLKASVELHEVQGLVKVHPYALGEKSSVASFEAKNGRWAQTAVTMAANSSQAPEAHNPLADDGHAGPRKVEVHPMSKFIKQDVLLFKVDTESFESFVFAGSWPILEKYNVQNVVVEVKDFNTKDKRELLYNIFTKGRFKFVYSYKEEYWSYTGPIQKARVNGTDVTQAVKTKDLSVELPFEDFWFSSIDRSAVVFAPVKSAPKTPAVPEAKPAPVPKPAVTAAATPAQPTTTQQQQQQQQQADGQAKGSTGNRAWYQFWGNTRE